MDNSITETGTAKHAVLFMCGSLNEVTKQFAEMLKHCQKKNLHVVDMFFDTSTITSHEKACYHELLDFIKHTNIKTAVVFYDNKSLHKYADTNDFLQFMKLKDIELHLAKNRIILKNRI